MSRPIDIKALVSHIVRGDGSDKCRICMGDTSEGQVHLGDTVMLDGEKPVTLAELLETITGVTVLLEDDMPAGLCSTCAVSALSAANFRTLCRQAAKQWVVTLKLLESLPESCEPQKALVANINNLEINIVDNFIELSTDTNNTDSRTIQIKRDVDEKDSAMECKLPKHRKKNHRLFRVKKISAKSHYCQCPDCGKAFAYAQHLYQHLKESTDFKRACFICAKIMQRDELVQHLGDVHDTEPYACRKCPALLRSSIQYSKHMAVAHSPGAYTCGDCGRSFQSLYAYNAHHSVHSLNTCPSCNRNFRNQTCYLYHVKTCCNLDISRGDSHRTKNKVTFEVKNLENDKKVKVGLRGSTDKECVCDYCKKTFAGKKFVAAHIQIVHMKNTHRPCVYCGKLLAAAHMTVHVKKHEQVSIFTCEICGVVLKSKLGYIQHNRLHTGEKPYACMFCGQKFSASSRRSEHIRKIHKTSEIVLKHACEFCPARFRLPYRLKKHIAMVHKADGDPLLFECNECHAKFSSCRGLLHHSRKHQQVFLNLKKTINNTLADICK